MSSTLTRSTSGLPGISLPERPADPRPDRLLAPGALLLTGSRKDQPLPLPDHRGIWGDQPALSLTELANAAASIQLLGAGGAAFPTARKLKSLAGRRVKHVIVNGSEGESASAKDGMLLAHVPQLVLDGAVAAAHALGAGTIIIRIAEDRPQAIAATRVAIDERKDLGIEFRLSLGPADFIAGEASSVIQSVFGGPALPADLGRPPRSPQPRRVRRSFIFLSNVETFARLAVASRGDTRTSALITLSGAVRTSGVLELPDTTSLSGALAQVGKIGNPALVITGGWQGAWVPWSRIEHIQLTRVAVAEVGGRWGAGAFVVLPAAANPTQILASIVDELAGASAGQCGPCLSGLPALAQALDRLQTTSCDAHRQEVTALLDAVSGRGLCAHPTATAAAIRSALNAIDDLQLQAGAP